MHQKQPNLPTGPTCRAQRDLMNVMLDVAFDLIKEILVLPEHVSTDRSPQLIHWRLTTTQFELQITAISNPLPFCLSHLPLSSQSKPQVKL